MGVDAGVAVESVIVVEATMEVENSFGRPWKTYVS